MRIGDPVTAYFYLNCGHCRWCLANLEPLCANAGGNVGIECDGGYAEYIKLPAHLFIRLPEGLDYKSHPAEIGVITDALATPYKVLEPRAHQDRRDRCRFGAGGGLGIHQVMMAKWATATVIAVDVAAAKFEACRKAGADETVDASAWRRGRGAARPDPWRRRRRRDRLRVVGSDAGSRRQGAGPSRAPGDAGRRRTAVPRLGARPPV